MNKVDVYMYGMVLVSNIHILSGQFPEPDEYQEIKESFAIPGGETGSAAIVLAKLGLNVKIAGPYLGEKTYLDTIKYLEEKKIDCTEMSYKKGFEGFQDTIYIAGDTRTIFGKFGKLLFSEEKYWIAPEEDSIKNADIIALDPFFRDESEIVAKYCVKNGKKYVTIDFTYDSYITKNTDLIVCSKEFLDREFKIYDKEELMKNYIDVCNGLVIFTFGKDEILYARKGQEIQSFKPYTIEAIDTLGAGDTFKGATAYGVYMGWDDDKIIDFASAASAIVCTRTPGVMYPPSLEEVLKLMDTK